MRGQNRGSAASWHLQEARRGLHPRDSGRPFLIRARAHMHRRVHICIGACVHTLTRADPRTRTYPRAHLHTELRVHSLPHPFFCVFIQQRLGERSLDVSTGDSTVAGQAAQIQRNRLSGPVGLGL